VAQSRKQVHGDETVHYVSQRQRRGRPEPKLQPPLTPMIDVTFLLLLYFLLTTTFRQEEGQIPGTLPEKAGISAGDVVPLEPIRLTLRPTGPQRNGCIYEMSGYITAIDNAEQLYEALIGRRQILSDEVPVVIQPRPDVNWRYVVEAFNQSVRAKFKNIAFASAG